MIDKSPDAFRTISEVAEVLETPAHVLRFWETRFPQIRPVKRAGGRRYYRPNDVALITGIKYLLHNEGMTIRGVQKMLRDQGVRHVASLVGAEIMGIDEDAEAALAAALAANFGPQTPATPPERATSATVVALETALRRSDSPRRNTSAPIIPIAPQSAPSDTPFLPGLEAAFSARPSPSAADIIQNLRARPTLSWAANSAAAALLARARALHGQMLDNSSPITG